MPTADRSSLLRCHAAAKRLGYRLVHNTGRTARRGVPEWRLFTPAGVVLIEGEDMRPIADYLERAETHY